MDIELFQFALPEALIAQTPSATRTGSRLMTLNRRTGEIGHRRFTDIVYFLQPGDTLVLNDSKVIPARLLGVKKHTGAKAELLLLRNLGSDRWEALARPAKRLKAGSVIEFGGGHAPLLTAIVEEDRPEGGKIVRFSYRGIFPEILDELGEMPLPPYIHERLQDKDRYQTVYARYEGSAAAPTAGLHFTQELLEEIAQAGIRIAYVTLHVGLGTFRPVSAGKIEEHKMHAEYYILNGETASILNDARKNGGRIVAVGTTSARTLETLGNLYGDSEFAPCAGWTDIFIYPGYKFTMVDALLTNFHLPKSTLLMLVSAFAGRTTVLQAYNEAIAQKYRFFSFGDAMFIY
ncbi:MAG TPA: tRNA preQ1(34) S-adenosylmethionine ribosyltransferase-isomerase QueA [Bacilli bacterium]